MRYLILLAWGLLVTSCAAPRPYAPTPHELAAHACNVEVSRSENQGPLVVLSLYRQCMHAHGWTK